MTDWRYKAEPRNLTTADVDERIRSFATAPSSFGSYAPRVIPFEAVNRPLVTTLPLQPADGDEVRFLADADSGVLWHLRYRKSAQSIYQWEFLGGSPLTDEVATSETTASTTYADLATSGPALTLPLPGDYDVRIEAQSNQTNVDFAVMSYAIGSTAASNNDKVEASYNSANERQHNGRTRRKTGLTAVTLTAKYRVGAAGTATFALRTMSVIPVRVGRA